MLLLLLLLLLIIIRRSIQANIFLASWRKARKAGEAGRWLPGWLERQTRQVALLACFEPSRLQEDSRLTVAVCPSMCLAQEEQEQEEQEEEPSLGCLGATE